jgi:type IV pilus assembly protein PilY1
MATLRSYIHALRIGVLLMLLICLHSANASATDCNCSADTAEPPFLSKGPDPNVLLMIDNSASMYDVSYNDPARDTWECFDESFDPGNNYVGYFESMVWYTYNTETNRFEQVANPPDTAVADGILYKGTDALGSDVRVEVAGSAETGWKVTLHATGRFLNWATVSKFDIQKAILTGGKYDSGSQQWISEGRGCAGYRFAKQVPVIADGVAYHLTMGIKGNDDDTTLVEIFKITQNGYQYDACREAIDEVLFGTGNPQNAVRGCIDPNNESGNPDKQVLIHSTTDCWKYWKGDLNNWPQHTTTLLGKCQEVYESGIHPKSIVPSDPEYACFGGFDDSNTKYGYIGQCWYPSSSECNQVICDDQPPNDNKTVYQCNLTKGVEFCAKNKYKNGVCSDGWKPLMSCEGGEAGNWIGGYTGTGTIPPALDVCMIDAMTAYCGAIQMPQVVDASDLEFDTGKVYNLPAILTDGGLEGQLNAPIASWPVRILKDPGRSEPKGVIQEFSSRVRIGAMAFNARGSKTECDRVDMNTAGVLYACEDTNNLDGAQVIWPIGSQAETDGHTAGLISEINTTKANTWTPLAEMMYTAIGYYTQRSEYELNAGYDWSRPALPAPITEYCQNNNVLIITDGSSTADQHPDILKDMDMDGKDKRCGDLYGSTYFDDWTFYGRQGENLYTASPYDFFAQPEPINTFVVYTASDRSSPDDQCSSYGLLKAAVDKGGPNATNPGMTDVVFEGDDPEKLKVALRDAFKAILKRASSGSAASVISATRSGEGAVYQAIFWPGIDGPDGKPDVTWAGEVHSLLVDAYGRIYEDTDGDLAITNADERVIFFFDELGSPAETKACYGDIEDGICSGEVKSIHDVKYLWSAAEWLADISEVDILSNRTSYISNQKKRYIFTWNDLDNDGIVDANEILPFDTSTNWNALSVDSDRRNVAHDFGVETTEEVDQIVAWLRGKDSAGLRSRQVVRPSNFNVTASADNTITWRLGDIIHSTPTVVGRPAESYHLLYQDSSYAGFAAKYKDRRQVVYFGGNDGKIHAVNGGFYNTDEKKYCLTPDCTNSGSAPALGAELWAYVPYNLQPQLKCLLDPLYLHRYYVDQKPRIFDVQIFENDDDHPDGWGTILVAGMRFGGNTVSAVPVTKSTIPEDSPRPTLFSMSPIRKIRLYCLAS